MLRQALSIVKPAVEDILAGRKLVEIRSWAPPKIPLVDLVLVQNTVYLRQDGQEDPDGVVLALVDVVGVHDWTPDEARSQGKQWCAGYVCWELTNVRAIDPPVQCIAKRGIYALELARHQASHSSATALIQPSPGSSA
ncbi:ASCH domain-containing protein [Cupriavidus basilensis]|uniref:ASCH domain-containing protein n=1 Tax=Cupriavidus basilensis TaxID=68895 RepID=A0ABT6ATR3_9BURK|nr:ASCH domain-containing protein [Cupriavidus basilensis]MDF3836009.1 ASCH domain-containing protein [Cupriavidus basilensis]